MDTYDLQALIILTLIPLVIAGLHILLDAMHAARPMPPWNGARASRSDRRTD
jgi:hypothetical protein